MYWKWQSASTTATIEKVIMTDIPNINFAHILWYNIIDFDDNHIRVIISDSRSRRVGCWVCVRTHFIARIVKHLPVVINNNFAVFTISHLLLSYFPPWSAKVNSFVTPDAIEWNSQNKFAWWNFLTKEFVNCVIGVARNLGHFATLVKTIQSWNVISCKNGFVNYGRMMLSMCNKEVDYH